MDIQVDRHVFSRANGGIRYRQGKTEIFCVVHGPKESTNASNYSISQVGNIFQLGMDATRQAIGNDHNAIECYFKPANGPAGRPSYLFSMHSELSKKKKFAHLKKQKKGCKEKFIERTLRLWLGTQVIAKLLPRAYVQVVFQVVHDDGAVS